jgi:xanthine/uracil/vitamin C permease (AzgA family)
VRGTSARTEAIAGAVTFMTMAYIVAVNPAILADAGLLREATCLGGVRCTRRESEVQCARAAHSRGTYRPYPSMP